MIETDDIDCFYVQFPVNTWLRTDLRRLHKRWPHTLQWLMAIAVQIRECKSNGRLVIAGQPIGIEDIDIIPCWDKIDPEWVDAACKSGILTIEDDGCICLKKRTQYVRYKGETREALAFRQAKSRATRASQNGHAHVTPMSQNVTVKSQDVTPMSQEVTVESQVADPQGEDFSDPEHAVQSGLEGPCHKMSQPSHSDVTPMSHPCHKMSQSSHKKSQDFLIQNKTKQNKTNQTKPNQTILLPVNEYEQPGEKSEEEDDEKRKRRAVELFCIREMQKLEMTGVSAQVQGEIRSFISFPRPPTFDNTDTWLKFLGSCLAEGIKIVQSDNSGNKVRSRPHIALKRARELAAKAIEGA